MTLAEWIEGIRDTWGCPKSKIRLHDYQWSAAGGWWMRCTHCGKRVERS